MTTQPMAEAVDRFHRLELAGGLFAVPERPVLAAIGTLAPRALSRNLHAQVTNDPEVWYNYLCHSPGISFRTRSDSP